MRVKNILYCTLAYLVLYVLLQYCYKFHFFWIEQTQLFQNTAPYIFEKIQSPGGLAIVISSFLMQFFAYPFVGAAIISALLILIGGLSYLIVRYISPQHKLFVLPAIVFLSLFACQFDINYKLQGTIAFLLTLVALYYTLKIPIFNRRLIVSIILVCVLFVIAGAVIMLYAFCVISLEMVQGQKKRSLILFVLLELALIAFFSVEYGIEGSYASALLPNQYFYARFPIPVKLYFSWITLPCCLLFAVFSRKWTIQKKPTIIYIGLQLILIFVFSIASIFYYGDWKSAKLKELDYYARMEQWDKIIDCCQGRLDHPLYLNYLNIALIQKGELADRMFSFDQQGPSSLGFEWHNQSLLAPILSDLYFSVGLIALSQKMAFENNTCSIEDGNPRMLKRLIQTNLISGAYPIAEKYISILENTIYYKKWANHQRTFLYNDSLVIQDQLLGSKRKYLLVRDDCLLTDVEAAEQLAISNPMNATPIQFMGAKLLLAKDLQNFETMLNHNYATYILPKLPISFQEALMILSLKEEQVIKSYSVSDRTKQNFEAFQKLMFDNRSNTNAKTVLAKYFGNTYWYYYIFKE